MKKLLALICVAAMLLAGCQMPTQTPAEHTHTLVHNEAKAPTCVNNGILEHWYCPACNARFTDEAATKEVAFADLEIEELGHTAGEDDGDCTTAVDCTVCGKVATAAKAHTPAEDDGDCTTAVACTECEKNAVEAKEAHEAAEDDGDCTTAVTCKYCDHVFVAAAEDHTPAEDDGDCTTAVKCVNCDVTVTEAKAAHEADEDDGNCTTAVKCAHCDAIITEAKEAHDFVDGSCTVCDAELVIGLTVDSLGLTSNAYTAGTATVGGVGFEWIQLGNYGDGIQVRDKNGNTSSFWNTTAFHAPIAKIELVFSSTKSTYDNTDAEIFSFGDGVNSYTYSTKLSTTADVKTYTITPDAETYTFMKFEHDLSYSMYWESITIYLVDGTVVTAE